MASLAFSCYAKLGVLLFMSSSWPTDNWSSPAAAIVTSVDHNFLLYLISLILTAFHRGFEVLQLCSLPLIQFLTLSNLILKTYQHYHINIDHIGCVDCHRVWFVCIYLTCTYSTKYVIVQTEFVIDQIRSCMDTHNTSHHQQCSLVSNLLLWILQAKALILLIAYIIILSILRTHQQK